MSLAPFKPVASLSRFVMFADTAKIVKVFDETLVESALSYVVSQSLARDNPLKRYTLASLTLYYNALAATSLTVKGSPDGGTTWPQSRVVPVIACSSQEVKFAHFSFRVTGFDVRFRIELPLVLVNIFNVIPFTVERGYANYQ